MKKNILMVSVIATLLMGVLISIDRTQAQTAQITLSVTASTMTCWTLPTAVSLGTTPTATTSTNLTTDAWTNQFTCTDLKSTWSTQLLAISTNMVGATTWTIWSGNITWVPTGTITPTAWDCGGVTLGAGGVLSWNRTIIQKAGVKTCSFTYVPDGMSIVVPAYSPVNAYTATMTISLPL